MTELYKASHVKRQRATKEEVIFRRTHIYRIVEEMKPMTVRQVFYQSTVHNIVEKSITDGTRLQRKPQTFSGVEEALQDTAAFYRKALWRDASSYVEIWLEKDALSGVVYPVTSLYDVPLMVARGYASLSFLHGAAEYIGSLSLTESESRSDCL
jgi:hypothetical protein